MEMEGFRPFLFSSKVENFWSPPFDTISPEEERELKKNEHNITHITLPHGSGSIAASAATFRTWAEEGVLSQPTKDCLILLRQRFSHNGKAEERIGVVSLVRVYPDDGSIKPHEMTFEGPRKNREEVMNGLGLIPEPIFLVSPGNALRNALSKSIDKARKVYNFYQPKDVENTVFLLDTGKEMKEIMDSTSGRVAIVADGHHRLAAIKELAKKYHGGWEYAMAYIVSSDDPALFISGIHRIVTLNQRNADIIGSLRKFVTVVEEKTWNPRKGIFLYSDGKFYSISIKTDDALQQKEYLDDPGMFVRRTVLEEACTMNKEEIEAGTIYSHDSDYAIKMVDEHRASMAILMPDWNKKVFTEVVSSGRILSQKSTFFYPKPPSGIAIYRPCYHCIPTGKPVDL